MPEYAWGKNAIARNAAVRAALATHWPDTKFRVRNGIGSMAGVYWTDGPTERMVRTFLDDSVKSPSGGTYWVYAERKHSLHLYTVSYLRAHLDGTLPSVEDDRFGQKLVGLIPIHLDVADVTGAEWSVAETIVSLSGVHPDEWLTSNSMQRKLLRIELADAIASFADAVIACAA